ncbi:MAG: hypothetical protein WBE37_14815 [Bryobacteraceae bacterium]
MPPLRLAALVLGCAFMLAAAPAVTGVYNAGSWLPPALPNSGIAQGAIFTLTGTGLGPSALQQAVSYPLPTTQGLGGTTIQATVGGVTETCIMIYTSAAQVAAILPSATPVGTGMLKLSYQGESSSIAIQVLAADFGTLTLNEGGTGPAVVTDPSYVPITMINAAHPGDTLILWGTGLGAAPGNETEPPTQTDLNTGVQVLVGDKPATVTYGVRGSSPGLDQINFVVPAGVTGCKTSIAVVVKGVTGNVTTTSIAPSGQTTCGDTFDALTAANLQKAIASGTLNIAGVELSRLVGGDDELAAAFTSFPVNSLIRSYGGTFGPSVGNCLAYEVEGGSFVLEDPVPPSFLNTGSQLVISGPGGTRTIAATSTGYYAATLASGLPFFIESGSYTADNGAGGSNVGAFSWDLNLPASVIPTVPASINRGQDLTLTWTGGSAFPVVAIYLFNGVKATSSLKSYVDIICSADASSGTFTISSALLSLLPADGYATPTTPGVLIQLGGIAQSSFTVPGTPGIDEGFFTAFISNGTVAAIQ